ncbi:hypothetical protein TNCV_583181 [Trichonephila clavipes]|nr:hypothetical protein TNCV_583181 [Trichonephila clavipes]
MRFTHFRHRQWAMNMNRYTNTELTDIHFIYDPAHGNRRVAVWFYEEDIQRGGNQITKRSFGCIRTWRNEDLSEPRLTTCP